MRGGGVKSNWHSAPGRALRAVLPLWPEMAHTDSLQN
jgi:hypothetical protein